MWLQLMMPLALLLVGHGLLTTKRFLITEQGKVKADADSAESNRNLARMFQGQGQLDMAFDRFRKCPMDDSLMDAQYSLGLDFERKRQFNMAESVFAYMATHNPKFKDLAPYTKADNLLPVIKVMHIVAKVADALDYAHAQNIVHRDIKPANIMYEADADIVKVTDFGIVRITDSSKTKTGMVLGTPSCMPPEQLSDKKVDGRSDLFSLGVMLYQMTTGTYHLQEIQWQH